VSTTFVIYVRNFYDFTICHNCVRDFHDLRPRLSVKGGIMEFGLYWQDNSLTLRSGLVPWSLLSQSPAFPADF